VYTPYLKIETEEIMAKTKIKSGGRTYNLHRQFIKGIDSSPKAKAEKMKKSLIKKGYLVRLVTKNPTHKVTKKKLTVYEIYTVWVPPTAKKKG